MGEELEFYVNNIYIDDGYNKFCLDLSKELSEEDLKSIEKSNLPLIIDGRDPLEISLEAKLSDDILDILVPPVKYDDIEKRAIHVDMAKGEDCVAVTFVNVPEEYTKYCGDKFYRAATIICNKLYKKNFRLDKEINFEEELKNLLLNSKYIILPNGDLEIQL